MPDTIALRSPIRDILKPKSVAISGASRDPSKRGYRAIQARVRQGFSGPIYCTPATRDLIEQLRDGLTNDAVQSNKQTN